MPADPPASPLDRCPNCDQPLQYSVGQSEAYCPSCKIFIEILRPLSSDEPRDQPSEPDAVRLQTARLYLDLDESLGDEGDEEPTEAADAGSTEPSAAEVPAGMEPPAADAETARAQPGLPTDEELDALFAFPMPAESTGAPSAEADVAAPPAPASAAAPQPRGWHRILFYAGSLLVAIGGSGLALGSVLHDFFRVPWFGGAYDAFGNLNATTLAFGSVVLVAGVVAMAVGARAGTRRRRAVGA